MSINSEYLKICTDYLDEKHRNIINIITGDLFTKHTLAKAVLQYDNYSPALICPDVTLYIMGYLRGRDLANFAKANRGIYQIAASLSIGGAHCVVGKCKYGQRYYYMIAVNGVTLKTHEVENFVAYDDVEALGKIITGITVETGVNYEPPILSSIPPYSFSSEKLIATFCRFCGNLYNFAILDTEKSYTAVINCYDCKKCSKRTTNLRITIHSPTYIDCTAVVSYYALFKLDEMLSGSALARRIIVAVAKHHGWKYSKNWE